MWTRLSVTGERGFGQAMCRWSLDAKYGWFQKFPSKRGDLVTVQFASWKQCFKTWLMTSSKMAEVKRQAWKVGQDGSKPQHGLPRPWAFSTPGLSRRQPLGPSRVSSNCSPAPMLWADR